MISGFTIIKNAVLNDYPIVEAIYSILPVVDEMVVLVGDCNDGTLELITAIKDCKIKIHRSVWNPNLRKGGEVLADETNKAFALINPAADWAFYIQADEVVPEQYHPAIQAACQKYETNKRVQGLLFKYLHFYGTYDYIGDSRRWYNCETRIIRNNKKISSYKDAQGFRIGHTKLWVKAIDAWVYHYGWVKSPRQMLSKHFNVGKYWNPNHNEKYMPTESDVFNFEDFDSLAKFTGTHPAVMQQRISNLNWSLQIDVSQKKFSLKQKILYYFEKLLGIRLFDFKNHKKI